ncbi:MAG: hypothetical protein OXI70_02005, partial [Chloroflexota bacterium]|nr:hypothetical protein [Chloroflexota bacterium]
VARHKSNPPFPPPPGLLGPPPHDAGLEVRAFGIRTTAELRRAVSLGADGATVDWFRASRRLLEGDQRAVGAGLRNEIRT